jgi:hypothetical protein
MMTTAALNEMTTVRDFLFGGVSVEPTDALAESLRKNGTVENLVTSFPGLTAAAGRAVEREVATVSDSLLSLDLLDLAAAGWNRYEALKDAARHTRDEPTAEEVVALVTHRIESSHRPTVELFIDGKSVGTIHVELDVTFDMAGVIAVVRQARLTAIRSGNCTVTGTLAIEGAVVAEKRHPCDLPGAVRLHHGVALLRDQTASTPVQGSDRSAPAGWYPDTKLPKTQRYWDGTRWTDHTAKLA